jgi:hypothetical protein
MLLFNLGNVGYLSDLDALSVEIRLRQGGRLMRKFLGKAS